MGNGTKVQIDPQWWLQANQFLTPSPIPTSPSTQERGGGGGGERVKTKTLIEVEFCL